MVDGRFSRRFFSLPLVELLRFHPGHAITATKRKKNTAILHRLMDIQDLDGVFRTRFL